MRLPFFSTTKLFMQGLSLLVSLLPFIDQSRSKASAMSSGNDVTSDDSGDSRGFFPLIDLPTDANSSALLEASNQVIQALETSGFLLIKSEQHLPLDLQHKALAVATEILTCEDNDKVIKHPIDPKLYIMMESPSSLGNVSDEKIKLLERYCLSLEAVKRQVLKCIAIGLDMSEDFFVDLHQTNSSVLRLLHYPRRNKRERDTTHKDQEDSKKEYNSIRCKAHSDYGSVTLLLTDGVPGLQALVGNEWRWVPHEEGCLVVNIGSLLSDWTKGKLLATLHRVVEGDDSNKPRTSLAFFADPDPNAAASLKSTTSDDSQTKMTVAEYIQWRSGGSTSSRSGIAFVPEEKERVEKTSDA